MLEKSRVTEKRLKALTLIRKKGEISRGELAAELSMDKKTVSNLVDNLFAESLITSGGFRDSTAGRRQELLTLNGSHSDFIGIDLGGTHVIGILVDLNGQCLDRVFFEIRPGLAVEIIVDQMKTICRKLLESKEANAPVRAIGICAPGSLIGNRDVHHRGEHPRLAGRPPARNFREGV